MTYTKDKLEELADAVNRKYFPERLSSAIALDPYDLVDKLGCTVDWKYISPDDTILGATFFSDSVWPVWPNGTFKKGDMCTFDLFLTGTIVINQRVLANIFPLLRLDFTLSLDCLNKVKLCFTITSIQRRV